jgi:hypothetical protein
LGPCGGDCDASEEVTIDEIIVGVTIALGQGEVVACPAFDDDGSGRVEVTELVIAVNNALNGCPPR